MNFTRPVMNLCFSRHAVLYDTPTPADARHAAFAFQIVKKSAASLINSRLDLTLW